MASPAILFNTVRHLRAEQIYHRLYRPKPALRTVPCGRRRVLTGKWTPHITKPPNRTGEATFSFLNQTRTVTSWNDPAIPKLWLYNLHYFDQPESDLITRWINENPIGYGNGWEPYPLSIRIMNWVKWALNGGQLSETALNSLQAQSLFLMQSVEHHLGANHLFANAVALTMAGLFCEGADADRCLQLGSNLLRRELDEQILSDGGHYERSPMYHATLLENVLDLINVSRAFEAALLDEETLVAKAEAMLGWLTNMVHPDGDISFFNDATLGIAPTLLELRQYAERLCISTRNTSLCDSGYVRLNQHETVLLFDAAPIGPDHQPGHAHADTLSFEVSHRGQRLIVNSGVSTYEKGQQRQSQRSTAAHNTLKIDDLDQSEVWSGFRVGRRARPSDVRTDGITLVEAAHDGYKRLRTPIVHRRRIELAPTQLVITDSLEGRGKHRAQIFFHFHPDAKPQVHFDAKLASEIRSTEWYPGFNKSLPNFTAVGAWYGECPVVFRTVIPLPL